MRAYEIVHELEDAGIGNVYLVRDKSMGYYRVMKKIPGAADAETRTAWLNEIYTLMSLDHPYIAKLIRVYDDGQHLYIVSDFCQGPSLHERLKHGRMSELEAGTALRHMLKAIKCCQSHYKGHYNVKPTNFMFTDVDCVKLKMVDFGSSSKFKRETTTSKVTSIYTAPEAVGGMYGPEADVWSCGAILFLMTLGEPLCPDDAGEGQVAALLMDRRWLKERLAWASQHVSAECMELLGKMLCHDRHMRITASNALKHRFLEANKEAGEYLYPQKLHRLGKDGEEEEAREVIKCMTDSFVSFGKEPVLVRAALLVMAHLRGHTTMETRIHRLAYSLLDRGGSGELSLDSMEAAMPRYGLETPANLHDAFRSVDLSRTGYITYNSFLAATMPVCLRCREDLSRRVFNFMDKDKDGVIGVSDVATTFLSTENQNDEKYIKLCRDAVTEISGSCNKKQIGFEEFLNHIVGSNSIIAGEYFEGR